MTNTNNKKQHELFDVDFKKIAGQRRVVRQDRISFNVGKGWIEIFNTKYEIFNLSSFGCALIIPDDLTKELLANPDIQNRAAIPAKVYYQDIETQELKLHFVREIAADVYKVNEKLWAFEVVGEPIELFRLTSLEKSKEIIQQQEMFASKRSEIPSLLRSEIYEIRDWLDHLRNSVSELEKNMPIDGTQNLMQFRTDFIESLSSYIGTMMPEMYKKVLDPIQKLNTQDRDKLKIFVRGVLGPYIYGAPFAARAYYKPRGYAGDFEMMNQLYRNEGEGNTLFDQVMHKYFVDEPAGEAVKNRANYLVDKLAQLFKAKAGSQNLRIASIASGPAMEIQMLLDRCHEFGDKKVDFYFFDQDEESLKHAQRQIITKDRFVKTGWQFHFVNMAIKNIIAEGLPEIGFDLIYSAGLFDYFSDPVAKFAAEKLFTALNKKGLLVIGNFNIDNPTTPIMEVLLDWNLIYRSSDDLKNLFKHLDSNLEVEVEPLKVNLFANLKN